MNRKRFPLRLLLLCCACLLGAAEPADEPAPKYGKDGQPAGDFPACHESFLKRGRAGPIGLLFIGDSITAWWSSSSDTWKQHFGAYQPANFGIPGDRTQHVLWRIANGELDGIAPRVVVLLIGTNNKKDSVADIVAGERKIVAQIRAKLPRTRLLLLGIFPRGADPTDPKVAELRAKISAVNLELAKLDDGQTTRFLDLGAKFLDAHGVLAKEIMPDGLHPQHVGYQIWADGMQPLLSEMLRDPTAK